MTYNINEKIKLRLIFYHTSHKILQHTKIKIIILSGNLSKGQNISLPVVKSIGSDIVREMSIKCVL